MDASHYRREVLEFVVGPPEEGTAGRRSIGDDGDLRWQCGCVAEPADAGGEYTVKPCPEHRSEFEESE